MIVNNIGKQPFVKLVLLWMVMLCGLMGVSSTAYAQTYTKMFGFCEQGGRKVSTTGTASTTTVQQTFPGCSVTVYNTGTATPTAIYSNSAGSVVKANPFVASTTTGYWEFYVLAASRLDVQLSGGIAPNNIATPFYWAVDVSASGLMLPTIYNQQIKSETFDAEAAAVLQRITNIYSVGLQAVDDTAVGATLIGTKSVPTGMNNIVTDFGANPDPTSPGSSNPLDYTTGTISSGSTTLVINNLRNFKKGQYIAILGLGVSGANFYAKILNVNTATKTLTLSAAPAGNGTNVVIYPDNYQPLYDASQRLSGGIYAPAGFYRVFNDDTRPPIPLRPLGEGNPTIWQGDGQGAAWFRAMGNNDLFRATSRQELTNLQIRNMAFDTDSTVRNTTKGWAFNLGPATVANFPKFDNIQITGFRGAIFCANCQGGGMTDSVIRNNKSGVMYITDQSTWLAGNENNVMSIEDSQFDFQPDPNTDNDRAVTGLSMIYEADNVGVTDASYIVTAATNQFVADDKGRILEIPGVGTDGGNLAGIILDYISPTQVRYSTRGVRTAGTVFSGAAGTIWRIPTSSLYIYRGNWLTLKNNIFQGNFGASTAAVNSVVIRNSNSVNLINHYSEQGGGSGGAHVRLIDSYGIKFDGFKTNSQGACVATPPGQVTSHCWDIWATNSPGTRVQNASGSLSILHNKLEGSSTLWTESLYGAPDLSNETGRQKLVYGDYHRNLQWGNVQIGTNTLYDATYGDNLFPDGRLVDGTSSWTTVIPSSFTHRTDGADRFKNYIRIDTTGLATASVTELLTKRINIPDGLMGQNFVLAFDYRPVTYPVGSDDTYSIDFYAKPSTGGTGYNWPTTFNWNIPGNNAAGLTPGYWYRLQVNLVVPEGTGRYFDIAIRGRRGALTPTVDFTNFMLMQGRHAAFSNKQPITDVDGGKIYGTVYMPNLAGGSDQGLVVEAATGRLKTGSSGGSGTVTSVQASVPSWLTVASGPITSSGTITINSNSVCASCAVIGPIGVTGALTARAIVAADLPGLDTGKLVTGQLAVARGGTGLSTASNNATMIGDGTNWISSTLPSCSNPTTDKMLYNTATRVWSCGVDQTAAGGTGITSLGGQTGATQTFAFTNGTNISGSWNSAGNIHTVTVGITGRLSPANLDVNLVYNQSTNTYTGGDQDMAGAASFKTPIISGYAPAASGVFGFNSASPFKFVGGENGVSKVFVTTSNSLGQVTNADVASAAGITAGKLAVANNNRILGAVTAGAAVELTGTQATAMLDTFTTAAKGLVTSPGGVSNTTDYLRRDGSWAAPAGTGITSLTTDVVASGSGVVAATIQPGVVTNAKLAVMAANSFKINNTGSSAAPIDGTVTQARALLGLGTTDNPTFANLTLTNSNTTTGAAITQSTASAVNGLAVVQSASAGGTGYAYVNNGVGVTAYPINASVPNGVLAALYSGGNGLEYLFSTSNAAVGLKNMRYDQYGSSFNLAAMSDNRNAANNVFSVNKTVAPDANTAPALSFVITPATTISNLAGTGTRIVTASAAGLLAASSTPSMERITYTSFTNSSPTNGDVWYNGNVFGLREKGVTKSLPFVGRVATNFSVTSSTTFVDVTGLTFDVENGRTYSFYADVFTTSSASGGIKFAIGGTATATSIIASAMHFQGSSSGVGTQRVTAMNTTFGDQTSVTTADVLIRGTFTASASGTVTLRFAQNASNVTSSVVLAGSTFGFIQVQ